MRRIIFILVFAVLAGLFPEPAFSQNAELTVSGDKHLSARAEPYIFAGVHVLVGGSLSLDPGVVISLTNGANIIIEGALRVNGTKTKPVLFQSSDLTESWGHFSVFQGGEATLTYLKFSLFKGPIQILATSKVGNLTMSDGIDNRLIVMANSEKVSIQGLQFINLRQGTDMQYSGVLVRGVTKDVIVRDVFVTDVRVPYLQGVVQIAAEELQDTFTLIAANFGYGCQQEIHTTYNTNNTRKVVVYAKIGGCLLDKVPVLFVPGIGTSINLKELSKSDSSTKTISPWHFSKKYSASYFTFLTALDDAHIAHDIAYYDWRLPAAEAATRYLVPAITALKKRTGSASVNIVAHSFGGLVVRSYVQGSEYAGDVLNLITLGTPNKGAAKAYSIWEAGILPSDWSVVTSLLRLYAYQHRKEKLTNQDVVHRYIRSAQDMLPRYPALSYGGLLQSTDHLYYQNTGLLNLEKTAPLLTKRVRLDVVYGLGTDTPEEITTNYPPYKDQVLWPDGEPAHTQPPLEANGDGTVPAQSAQFTGARIHHWTASTHGELPGDASAYILKELYGRVTKEHTGVPGKTHLFAFDCPIRVQLVLPNGLTVTSDAPSTDEVEVEQSDDMIWMIADHLPGVYEVHITALADTDVRAWVDDSPIETFALKKDEQTALTFAGTVLESPDDAPPSSSPLELVPQFAQEPNVAIFIPNIEPAHSQPVPALPQVVATLFSPQSHTFQRVTAAIQQKPSESNQSHSEKPYAGWVFITISFTILYCLQRE